MNILKACCVCLFIEASKQNLSEGWKNNSTKTFRVWPKVVLTGFHRKHFLSKLVNFWIVCPASQKRNPLLIPPAALKWLKLIFCVSAKVANTRFPGTRYLPVQRSGEIRFSPRVSCLSKSDEAASNFASSLSKKIVICFLNETPPM